MNDIPLVNGIERQMRYLAQRQQVLAQNIANSETPGYKAQEVRAPNFADLMPAQSGGSIRIPRPNVTPTAAMVALGATPAGADATIADTDVTETKPDGNNVTLEDQVLKLGRVQSDFAAMTGLYRKQQALLHTALDRGGGG